MKYFLAFFLFVLFIQNSFAIDLKGHQFTDSYRYSLLEDSYTEKFDGKNIFLGSYAYVRTPFFYTDSNVNNLDGSIIDYNNVLTLGYSRYVSEDLALGLDIVGVQNKVEKKSYSSFGDINLRGKYLLTKRGDSWGLSINPFLTLPTGKKENFTTTRSFGGGFRAVFEKHFTKWHWLGSLGYSHHSKNKFEIVDQRNLLLSQLGLSYDINKDWNINGEVLRNFTIASDDRQDEGDYFITLKNKTTEKLALYGGAGIAGTETVERNNYTVFVGFKWNDGTPPVVVKKPTPTKASIRKEKPKSRDQEAGLGRLTALENIYFENGSSVITGAERNKVMKVVEAYRRLGDKFSMVVVEGFASTRGNSATNEILAQKRTDQVMGILTSEGVSFEKISKVSYGDKMKQDPAEWKNRKVQFRIYQGE